MNSSYASVMLLARPRIRSYTYIIKNIYSDPSEVFDTIITDERILERARSVTEAYDEFIQA